MRCGEYLRSRPDVDPSRVALAGLCQGGQDTWLAGALDDGFAALAPFCSESTFAIHFAEMASYHANGDSSPFPFGILDVCDIDHLHAAIAPRPLMVRTNLPDNWWPVSGMDDVETLTRKVYRLYGAEDRVDFQGRGARARHHGPVPRRARGVPGEAPRVTGPERSLLRGLARELAEAAALPVQAERTRLWRGLNRLSPERPMVLLDPQNGWADLVPDTDLRCGDSGDREIERRLRQLLFRHHAIPDDHPLTTDWPVAPVIRSSAWGVADTTVRTEARGLRWDPPLKTPADLARLHPATRLGGPRRGRCPARGPPGAAR